VRHSGAKNMNQTRQQSLHKQKLHN